MLKAGDLLDPILVVRVSSLETETLQELFSYCNAAVAGVLGSEAWSYLSKDELTAERTVPWVWDLARGFHFQSVRGSQTPQTIDLVDQLSIVPLDPDLRQALADTIDWPCILTEDRVAEWVQGRGAIRMDAIKRENLFPWYPQLLLGYRIRLTTEALRLMPVVG
jgi:hypothetical protein